MQKKLYIPVKDISDDKNISTKNSVLYKTDNFSDWYRQNIVETILNDLSEFQERDSGWALERILNLIGNIYHYNPLRDGCGVELPPCIIHKRAVINIDNEDSACFAWDVTIALYPAKPPAKTYRTSSYPHYRSVLDVGSLTFPTTLKHIRKFESDNNISVNVFTMEEENESTTEINITPLKLTKKKRSRHVNLLLITDDQGNAHFLCIRNLSRLISNQTNKRGHTIHICERCLHYFHTADKLQVHERDCVQLNDNIRVILPNNAEDCWVSFKNQKNSERVPFVVYADFECLLQKIDHSSNSNSNGKNSYDYQKHVPFSVGYYLKSTRDASLSSYNSHRGANCMKWFICELESIARIVSEKLKTVIPMNTLSDVEISRHYSEPNCHICGKPYRGPAHNNCNLNFKDSHDIPVIFHNLSGYDSQFIFEAIVNTLEGSVYLLPVDKEKYNSFSKYLRNLLTRKGIFPYDYVDNITRLEETVLPARELFYNRMSDSDITEKAYNHAKEFRSRSLLYASSLHLGAMLKHTGIRLELFTDVDMLLFMERGIRGGLSQCSHRYERANNRYMRNYDPAEPSKYLMYYDVNNLYGWSMCHPVPTHGFQWIDDAANLDILNVSEDTSEGYILEVDLKYPSELHDKHSDLPFCPCIPNGIVLKRIYRGLKFRQSIWLKAYIELNTRLRTASKNDFEKNLFKLMNNAVFGRTIENVRNIVDVRLFDKPVYVGMCVLDISKTCLYEFHYDYMLPTFGSKCKAMYTDTDSLVYSIECDDVHSVMKHDLVKFDTSDYPADNRYDLPRVNKKVPELMKDENNGKIMTKFVGLRGKMYTFKNITFDDYKDCLDNFTVQSRNQNLIRSKLHKMFSTTQRKIALSPYDDKRHITPGTVATLPWAHYRLKE
ncbi:uncharacterized protein [Prorops nasuta]|uniref:uncharacterized protein n=1 Tax=Prorops nasuta TaxID=863751 RepID=UPI0034CF1AEF